jgi:hypothetical protein
MANGTTETLEIVTRENPKDVLICRLMKRWNFSRPCHTYTGSAAGGLYHLDKVRLPLAVEAQRKTGDGIG